MSVFLDISAALDSHLNSMSGVPPVAWENRKYEPVIGTLYLRPTLLPAQTVGATISTTGTDENTGIYQVDIFSPIGEGKGEAINMADDIAERFKPVTELTYNDRLIRTISVSRAAGRFADGWYHLPVEIRYLALTTKR